MRGKKEEIMKEIQTSRLINAARSQEPGGDLSSSNIYFLQATFYANYT